jgi:ferritin-like metal-binding protein YciE
MNRRDLTIELLGQLLYVERRLADEVLAKLAAAVHDDELQRALEEHRAETKSHAERAETAFRRLEIAPTSNRSPVFESAVAQHDRVAASIGDARLGDIFHAQAALHTELWEIASYRTLRHLLPDEVAGLLHPSLEDEERAAKLLDKTIKRLTAPLDDR